ncbi:MAG: transcriptional regulator [Candidatus Kapaibacterium sp.]|nr:MAG: transcriptional regulator [Candidatus Kapabacteria bacterium]
MPTQSTSILTEAEYTTALRRIYDLIQQEVPADSPKFAELDTLTCAVECYEQEHFPLPSLVA